MTTRCISYYNFRYCNVIISVSHPVTLARTTVSSRMTTKESAQRDRPGHQDEKHDSQDCPAAPHVAESAQAFGAAVGESGSRSPALTCRCRALSELQAEYLQQATEMWNQALRAPASTAKAPPAADRRFAAHDWAATRPPAMTAQIYLLNARTLMKMAESVEGDAKTSPHPLRRAAVGRRGPPEQLPGAQPRGAAQGARDQGREHRPGPAAPVARRAARAMFRRPTRARSRSAATSPRPRARWCSRTSCSS